MASKQAKSVKDPNRKRTTRTVPAGIRTYRFVIVTKHTGKQYLSIVEERTDGSSRSRSRLVVFQRHMVAFHKEYLKAAKRLEPKLKVFNVEKIRKDYPNAFKPWTPQDDRRLFTNFKDGLDVLELAQMLGRQPGGIRHRLRTLGIE